MSANVVIKTIFVWNVSLRKLHLLLPRSIKTVKPMPPNMIRKETDRFTTTLPANPMSEVFTPCVTPITSNPALQKADTEVKKACQTPIPPLRETKGYNSSKKPMLSMPSVTIMMLRPKRTIPRFSFWLNSARITKRSRMVILRRNNSIKSVVMHMKPTPPN